MNTNIEIQNEEQEKWEGRYYVTLKVNNFSHRGEKYDGIEIALFQISMDENEAKDLLAPFGITSDQEDYIFSVSCVEETFTEKQADELINYFEKSYPETTGRKELADQPQKNHIGLGAIPVGGDTDCFEFYNNEIFPFNYKVCGYYDTRPAQYESFKAEIMKNIELLDRYDLYKIKELTKELIKKQEANQRIFELKLDMDIPF